MDIYYWHLSQLDLHCDFIKTFTCMYFCGKYGFSGLKVIFVLDLQAILLRTISIGLQGESTVLVWFSSHILLITTRSDPLLVLRVYLTSPIAAVSHHVGDFTGIFSFHLIVFIVYILYGCRGKLLVQGFMAKMGKIRTLLLSRYILEIAALLKWSHFQQLFAFLELVYSDFTICIC